MGDQVETYQGLRLQLDMCRASNAELRLALDDHDSGSKQLAKWLEESRIEAMDAKRQAASDRARARMADTDLAAAKEELLKCVQWQHDLRQQLETARERESLLQHAVNCHSRNLQEHTEALNAITGKLSDLLARHRKDGITALYLALEELVNDRKAAQ
jgi:hypothetical protein